MRRSLILLADNEIATTQRFNEENIAYCVLEGFPLFSRIIAKNERKKGKKVTEIAPAIEKGTLPVDAIDFVFKTKLIVFVTL